MTISIEMYMLDVLIIACGAKRFNGLTLKFESRNEWLGIGDWECLVTEMAAHGIATIYTLRRLDPSTQFSYSILAIF